jgi:hypothetical protein
MPSSVEEEVVVVPTKEEQEQESAAIPSGTFEDEGPLACSMMKEPMNEHTVVSANYHHHHHQSNNNNNSNNNNSNHHHNDDDDDVDGAVNTSASQYVVDVTQQYMADADEEVKLFDGFSFALAYEPQDEETIWKVEDLKKKILENEGTFHEELNEKVNIILVLSTNMVDTNRIGHAMKFSIPIVSEQYVHNCVECNTRLDWCQYLVMNTMGPMHPQTQYLTTEDMSLAAAAAAANAATNAVTTVAPGIISTTSNTGNSKPPNAKANFQIKMYLKGSRQSVFTEQFPEVLYTLTWKHKYDVQIKASDKIFEGRSQSKILDALEVALVLSQTNEIPVYDEEEKKKKKKRMKTDDMEVECSVYNGSYPLAIPGLQQQQAFAMPAGFTGIPTTTAATRNIALSTARSKKRASSTKNSNETVCVSSLHKGSDDEIVIRFGVNSTFCSKRFNYGAFKLYINYAPPDVSDDFHFTIYSAEFKTFVKKNANISKYLHSPHPLSGIVTVVTKAMTQKMKVEYAKYMTADLPQPEKPVAGPMNIASSSSSKRRIRKLKKNKHEESTELNMLHTAAQYAAQVAVNSMGMASGFDPNFTMAYFMQIGMNPMATSQLSLMTPTAMQQHMLTSAYIHDSTLSPESVPETPQSAVTAANASNLSSTDGKYQWYGEPIGINVNGDIFYYAFTVINSGEIYKVGDFVFLLPTVEGGKEASAAIDNNSESSSEQMEADVEDWDRLWICKIINLVHTKSDGMKMIGQWFYRSNDLPDAVSTKIPNELFVSFDINYNQLHSIRGKCQVRHCKNPDSEEMTKFIQSNPHKHFFFRSGFNRLRADIFELGEGVLRVLRAKSIDGEDDDEAEEEEEGVSIPVPGIALSEHQAAIAQQHYAAAVSFDPTLYAHVHHLHDSQHQQAHDDQVQ